MTDEGSPTTGWTIERMVPERDLDELLELEATSFTNPWTRAMYEWEIQHSDVAHIFVLRLQDARLAAFCSVWLVFDELHINNLAVHPDHRRRGLGCALLQAVLDEGVRRGARRATLEVRRSNQIALRLYSAVGFSVAGIRPRYYRNPEEDALILWRTELQASGAETSRDSGGDSS
ncbi:MAG: ribosomal protein S18-alanine N-acetyltransferase [Acidobacteria bacterium]|nr:ribosomal protein S18-alanine N-acetyltransferase [Acidobacteriota bacterium]